MYLNTVLTLLSLAVVYGICCGRNQPGDSPEMRHRRENYRNFSVLLLWALLVFLLMITYGLV